MKRTFIYVFGLLLGLLLVVTVSAQDNPNLNRRTLKGIKGVRVFAGVAKDIEDAGLRTDVIKTDTELKLRLAGIRVLEAGTEFASAPGSPWLFVSVEGVSLKGVYYGFSVSVSLFQNVVLERDPSLKPAGEFLGAAFSAKTWDTTTLGVQVGNPSDNIRSTVKDLIDRFINAYLATNQKGLQ
jgi:hypothetical protein